MDQLVSLEKQVSETTKQLHEKSKHVEALQSMINSALTDLQKNFSTDKVLSLKQLEEDEKKQEEAYLECRTRLLKYMRDWRSCLIQFLEKEATSKQELSDDLTSSSQLKITGLSMGFSRSRSVMDEDDVDMGNFGSWEIDDEEIKFTEVEKLGRGTFGTVYRGVCRGKDVAVKVLRKQNFDPKVLEEFKKECHLMSKLTHPNIILFMGACTVPGKLKLISEIAKNGSVEDILKNKTIKLSFIRKMKIAQEAAQGMNWLHCMKPPLLHLDLKTANLLLTTEWHVKVADFGLSRVRGNDGDIKQVSSATVGGTPYYMAPELFLEKVTPDEKCDIYAYAIILWELVTEKNPYEGQFKNVHQLVQGILNENVRPIIPQSCPQMLKEVITKCWDKDSRKRPSFQSILDSKVFDEVALEAITTGNKACIRMWKGFNKDAMEDKEPLAVPWEEFLDGFCKMIKVKNTNKENIKFQCLRSVLDADKEPHGRVTQQAFQRFLQWFGPITEGVSILEQVKGLLEQKWFHGVMSAKEAENKIVPLKRGSYLVRFSSREEETSF